MINKKGFTLIEILAAVTILGIIATIGIAAYTKYKDRTVRRAYDIIMDNAISAADQYFMNHNNDYVTFDELINGDYMEKVVDPVDREGTCNGYVVITNKEQASSRTLEKSNYKVYVACGEVNKRVVNKCKYSSNNETCDDNVTTFDNYIKDSHGNITPYRIGFANYSFNSKLSLIARVKFNSDISNNEYMEVFGNWENAGGGLGVDSRKRFFFNLYDPSSWRKSYINSTEVMKNNVTFELNKWYVLVGTLGEDNKVRMYVNGIFVGESSSTLGSNIGASRMPFNLGGNENPGNTYIHLSDISVGYAMILEQTVSESDVQKYFSNPQSNMLEYENYSPLYVKAF